MYDLHFIKINIKCVYTQLCMCIVYVYTQLFGARRQALLCSPKLPLRKTEKQQSYRKVYFSVS